MTKCIYVLPGVQCRKSIRLHGAHLPGGQDKFLRETGGGVPTDGGDGWQQGQSHVHAGRRFLKLDA